MGHTVHCTLLQQGVFEAQHFEVPFNLFYFIVHALTKLYKAQLCFLMKCADKLGNVYRWKIVLFCSPHTLNIYTYIDNRCYVRCAQKTSSNEKPTHNYFC